MSDIDTKQMLAQALALYKKNEFAKALPLLNHLEGLIDTGYEDLNLAKDIFNYKGLIFLATGQLPEAETYFKKALKVCIQIGNPVFIYNRYDNLASVYILQGRNEDAIELLEKGMLLKETNKSYADTAMSLVQIASLQFSMESIAKGRDTLEKLKKIITKYALNEQNHNYHFLMGMMLKREKSFVEAIHHYLMAVENAAKFAEGDAKISVTARAFLNLAELYCLQNKFSKSIKACRQGREIAVKGNLRLEELMLLNAEAWAEIQLGNQEQANTLLAEAKLKSPEINNEWVQRNLEKTQAAVSAAEGNYKEAYEAHKKFFVLYEQYYNSNTSHKVQDIQGKYEHEKKERELQQIKLMQIESELKALRTQMNPHFIFNALGQMRKEMLEGNIENADRYLVRFSRLMRLILDTTRSPEIRLSENIELLHLYIQIEQARQGGRFSYSIKTGKNIEPSTLLIPGMLLQPLIENAIIHGLYQKTDGSGKLSIDISAKNGVMKIIVADNGTGRNKNEVKEKTGHTSHATSIIRETLALMWKGEREDFFKIKDKTAKTGEPAGTEVTVLLPLHKGV